MPVPKKKAASKKAASKKAPAADSVDAWVAACAHAERATLIALRERLRALRPDVEEGVKWNAPSYRTNDWFATFFARPGRPLQLVLHAGARAKGKPVVVADPLGLLQRKDAERAVITLDGVDVDVVAALARAWLDAVDPR
jgi:hypothetical protein